MGLYNFWSMALVGYYQQRNHHRSLEVAIQAEKEWDLIKPKDDDDDDEEEEEWTKSIQKDPHSFVHLEIIGKTTAQQEQLKSL